ncbi:MAG TPA: hypothetical protein VID48_14590 [Solirubrobacteraceae bacterium]|jgi:hypothetical protein
MNARLAGLVLALYPLGFRRRYAAEMKALLAEEPPRGMTLLDLLRGALAAHLRPLSGSAEILDTATRVRLSLSGVLACWVAFAAAGFGFYKTTEDHPFALAGNTHPLLGATHTTIQVFAVLASVALVAGALPAATIALHRARRERGRLRLLLGVAFLAVSVFAGTTGLLIALAHSVHSDHASPIDRGAFIAWGSIGLLCGGVCVVAARKALFAISLARRWLLWALSLATLLSAAMLVIAAASALYAVALAIDAPTLAGAPDGALAGTSTSISLFVQMGAMTACGALAITSIRRAWRALAST